jgi:two-component system, chemotaxis family, sensor kinase CheA
MEEITSVFIQESREQLAEMEAGLLSLEQNPDDHDNINAIFRAAHTIKGGSGVIECHFIETFTHGVENLLDALRNGDIAVSGPLATLLLECCDHIISLIDVLADEKSTPNTALQARGEVLTERLKQFLAAEAADTEEVANNPTAEAARSDMAVHDSTVEVETSGGGVVITDSWHISVRFGENVLRGGMDPLSFIRYLASLGEILGIETITDAMPVAAEMDPESCYMGFEIQLQTRSSKADIERVFDFVREDCDLRILPPHSKLADYIKQKTPCGSVKFWCAVGP